MSTGPAPKQLPQQLPQRAPSAFQKITFRQTVSLMQVKTYAPALRRALLSLGGSTPLTALTSLFALLAALSGVLLPLPARAQATPVGTPYNQTRTSAFLYATYAGLLYKQTVEPGDTTNLYCAATTSTIDAYGNATSSATDDCGASTAQIVKRQTNTTFASVVSTISVGNVATPVTVPAGQFPDSVTQVINTGNQTETRQYDPRFGLLVSLTGPNGLTTTWTLDDWGRQVRETRADGTASITRYCYLDGKGLNTSSNSGGCLNAASLPAGEAPDDAVMYTYAIPVNTGGAKDGPYVRTYMDAQGRVLRKATEAYDGDNQPASAGAIIVQDTDYNAYGAATLTTQPYFLAILGSTTSSTCADPCGPANGTYGMTLTQYDALGRPSKVYRADGHGSVGGVNFTTLNGPSRHLSRASLMQISYAGLTTTTTNDAQQVKVEEKNVAGQVVRVTDNLGAQIAYQYDAFGALVRTRDALQNAVGMTYDQAGRKASLSDPDTGYWQYDYDVLGELIWQQNTTQRYTTPPTVTTMAYDALGRMTQRVEPEYTSTWAYDNCPQGVGKLCTASTSAGQTKHYYYDSLGRPSSTRVDMAGGPSFASAVSYAPYTGKLASQTWPTGFKVNYGYTALGYLQKLVQGAQIIVNPLPTTPGGTPGTSQTLPAGTMLWQADSINAWGSPERTEGGNGVINTNQREWATGRITQVGAGQADWTFRAVGTNYTWDSLDHLVTRNDTRGDGGSGAVTDTYVYDGIGRLSQYTVVSPLIPGQSRTVDLQYNALGSLLYKTDVGVYTYGAQATGGVKPHAVLSIAPTAANGGGAATTYLYNGNGDLYNASAGSYRHITYTSFNLPDSQIGIQALASNPEYSWNYDENHQRIKEIRTIPSGTMAGTRTTWELHPDNQGGLSFESETDAPVVASPANPAATNQRHYLSAGGQTFAVLVSDGALPTLQAGDIAPPALPGNTLTVRKLEYWHTDYQGTLLATTDHTGAVTARYSYDPFGKRRSTEGVYDAQGTIDADWSPAVNAGTDRGYTGHEHLDDIGLVHMNGRIFDPTIGRFLQGDPYIGSPDNLQSYNRFSYCMNTPMTCTDPSGYWHFFGHNILPGIFENPVIRTAIALVAAYYTGGAASEWLAFDAQVGATATALGSAAAGGFVAGAIMSGNVQGALQGAFTAAAFAGVGEYLNGSGVFQGNNVYGEGSNAPGEWSVPGVVLHGVVGCVTSASSGAKCGPGALSAAFSQAALPIKGNDLISGLIVSSVVGGTASVLGGGKFSNGADTAAFGYLFNELLHQNDGSAAGRRRSMLLAGYPDGGSTVPYDPPLEGVYPEAYLLGGSGLLSAAGNGLKLAFSGGANSVFWSGYTAGALETASSLGTTLETTIGGRFLSWVNYQVGIKVPDSVWNWASSTFANQASGTAQAVIRAEGRVWTTIEKPILQQRGVPIDYHP
jgi:RHS repeat-associated protein